MYYVKLDSQNTIINYRAPSPSEDIDVPITGEQWETIVQKDIGSYKLIDGELEAVLVDVSQVSLLAKQVILSIASIEDQLNLTARAMEILELKTEDSASESDLAELAEIKAMQAKKKAILVRSQELQAQFVEAGEALTPEDLETIREELENA